MGLCAFESYETSFLIPPATGYCERFGAIALWKAEIISPNSLSYSAKTQNSFKSALFSGKLCVCFKNRFDFIISFFFDTR